MSYRFCLGASGAGKSMYLYKKTVLAAEKALRQPAFDRNFLIIVPDQFTMQTQKDLVLAAGEYAGREQSLHTAAAPSANEESLHAAAQHAVPRGGIMNIDVLSFSRLSHRIFEEIGADPGGVLDDMGKSLILRRLAAGCMKDLKVLDQKVRRPGMIAEVKSVISEFMQYGISADDVGELASHAAAHGQGALAAKLSDLQVLYRAFLDEHTNRFLTSEETLDLLAEAVPKSRLIPHCTVIFDGFTGFTPVQYRAILALMQCAQEVIFTLDYAPDGGVPIGDVMAGALFEEQDLFYLTRQTVSQICRMGERCGAERGEDIYIEGGAAFALHGAGGISARTVCAGGSAVPPRFAGNPALAHLERSLFRNPVQVYADAKPGGAVSPQLPIHLILASNPGEEVRQMFIRIRRLIAQKGYHYRDIAIVAGDLIAYEDEIRVYAERYDVPVYIDTRRAVTQNPLTETIRSALEIGGGDYSYETVFRFLRGGLSGLSPDAVDRLENYCLKRGIASRTRWETAFDPEYEPMRQAFLAAIRPLQAPRRGKAGGNGPAVSAAGTPGRRQNAQERTRALYEFLLGIHAGEQMQAMARRLREQGRDAQAMEYEQIYGAVIHLLDELYDLSGEEPVSAGDYLDLVTTGLQEIRIGTLPQQVDRIPVGDMERTRLSEVKVLFVLGVNDGSIPKGASGGGLLSDLDREFLKESGALNHAGASLAPTPREQMYIQRLYLYMNLTKPLQELYISYAATASDGKSLRPSYLIGLLQQMYPHLEPELPELAPVSEQMVAPKDAASFLAGALRDYADGLFLKNPARRDEVLTIYGFCAHKEMDDAPALFRANGDSRVMRLRDAAFSRYHPVPLSKDTARKIYGRSICGSVTRLETAANCYLRQFLQYGLRLKERELYTFKANDSGSILHDSIQRFGLLLQKEGIAWTEFTKEQGRSLMAIALRDAAGTYNDQILYATARGTYQAERLQRILNRTADTLQYQLRQGDFVPCALEQDFGGGGELSFALRGGGRLTLQGRIDRVDLARDAGNLYVKIVDYKSGKKDLDPVQMKAGLQLQLMLYMMAEVERLGGEYPGTEIVPAGMLYYRFDDPMILGDDAEEILSQSLAPGESAPADARHGEFEKTDSPVRSSSAATASDDDGADAVRQDPAMALEEAVVRRQLRPRGLVGREDDILHHFDHGLDGEGSKSGVLSIQRLAGKRDLNKNSLKKTYSAEEYQELSRALRETVCRLAEDILDGRTDAAPVRTDEKHTACTWCAYKDSCGFDPRIPGYKYRDLS